MNDSLYEDYMRSVLGYGLTNYRNTYDMNYDNYVGFPNMTEISNSRNEELEKCYPDIYRIVYPMVQKALKGINVAVASLLTSVIINFSKKTIKNFYNGLFMFLAFVLVFFFKVPSYWIIISAIIMGILIVLVQDKIKAKKILDLQDDKKTEVSEEGK